MNYYNEEQIKSVISVGSLIEEIERFYLSKREVMIPDRIHIDDGENTVLIMPAFDSDYYAIKLVGVAPGNKEVNKPSIYGTVVLHDRKTLEPLGMFDGTSVTSLRTGAIGGVAMKYLASHSSTSLGIIGTGIQGWSHLQAALAVRNIQKVYLYNRSQESMLQFAKRVKEHYPQLEVQRVNVLELVTKSDIIVTTTTSSFPVLPNVHKEQLTNKLIVAVGSFKPSMQEIPNSLLKSINPIYVDTETALTESGDLIKARELQNQHLEVITLEQLIGYNPPTSAPKLFKSVGMSLFDLITVRFIYKQLI